MKKIISFSIILLSLNAQYYHEFRTVEALSMGETRLSIYHNTRSFLANPALLVGQKAEFNVFSAMIKLDSKAFDYLDFVNSHDQDFKDLEADKETDTYKNALENIQTALRPFENQSIRNQVNFAIGLVRDNFGFMLQEVSTLHIRPDILFTPKFNLSNANEVSVTMGYGRQITDKLKLGVNFKFFTKNHIENLLFDVVRLSNQDATDFILDTLPAMTTGYSAIIGGLYQFWPDLTFSGVIRNLPGNHLDENPGVFFDFGAMYERYGVQAVFEYTDLFNIYELPFVQHLHFGFRYKIPYVYDYLEARIGFNQGFFTAGAGLDLYFFHLNYAFHQKAYSQYLLDEIGKSHVLEIRFAL
ncbi:MAG: hypothetical protein KDD94_03800 [Calditrichaeota bacterium]|nr:hypothetical protein [Calditrichota bacterium]